MFAQLLEEIHNGGTLEVNALASKYDTTPQMIAAMLVHLERLGVIMPYVDCGQGCEGCSAADDCLMKDDVRLWQSTGAK